MNLGSLKAWQSTNFKVEDKIQLYYIHITVRLTHAALYHKCPGVPIEAQLPESI